MGVQGLWTLLSPAGRKLKIEALEGQRLAIDVSIWVIRMLYGFASRKMNSEFKNIHLVGIFKRLCRLLSLGIKPVFVFDGKAPDLKRHTLYLRQQQREKRQINLQKLAEKYVIKQLEGKLKEGKLVGTGSKAKSDHFEDDDDLDSLNSDEMNEFEKNLNDYQMQIVDLEFQQILNHKKKYPNLLEGLLSNDQEFYIFDIASKIGIVQKANQRLLEIRNKDLSKVTDMEEFSKLQSKSYVEYVIQKREVNHMRDEGRKNLLAQQQNFMIDEASYTMNDKQKESLLNDEKNKITTGWLNSDRDKMFLFIQKNVEKEQEGQSAVPSTSNKIGLITKPIRKSKHEKNLEIQSRLSDLLKARETEAITWQKQKILENKQELQFQQEQETRDTSQNNHLIHHAISNIEIKEDNEEFINEQSVNFGDFDSEQKQNRRKVTRRKRSDSSDLSFGDSQSQNSEQDNHNNNHNNHNNNDIDDFDIQCEENNQVNRNISDQADNKMTYQNELDQAMIQSNSQISMSEDQNSINFMTAIGQEGNKVQGYQKSIQAESQKNSIENTQKRISEIVKKDQRNNYEILKQRALESQYSSMNKNGNSESQMTNKFEEDNFLQELDFQEKYEVEEEEEFEQEKKCEKKIQFQVQAEQKRIKETQIKEIDTDDEIDQVKFMFENQQKKNKSMVDDEDYHLVSAKKKREKEEFDKLIQKLKMEEELQKMNEEEKLKYYSKNPQQKQQFYREDQEEQDEDEEDDPEEMKKLLAQVEKWEEEQNKHVDDGIDLTDEQLEEEFQRFINLNELDHESIQDKFQQVRQLLLLFGVPWVEAPSEAEAQCAYLEQINLVDGIITDDSDVFLFGGKHIYRGLFGKETENVRYINREQIEKDLGIDREKLIYMALFLGSDYTLGIKGVGIVNAMEIVTAFENVDALNRFKLWASKADVLLEDPSIHYRNISLKEKNYKEQHKNYKKHWEIHGDFPSQKVINAYLSPSVDLSDEQFQWGKPSIGLLTTYCQTIFGWNDDLIKYILKPLEEFINKTPNPQKKITDYYKQASKFAVINSNRLKNAIKDLKQNEDGSYEQRLQQEKRIEKIVDGINRTHQNAQDKKRKTLKKGAVNIEIDEDQQNQDDNDDDDDSKDDDEFDNNLNAFQFNKNKKKKKKRFFQRNPL